LTEEQIREDEIAYRNVATVIGILIEFFLTIQGTIVFGFYVRHGIGTLPISYYPNPSPIPLLIAAVFPLFYSLLYRRVFRPRGRTVNPAYLFLVAFFLNTLVLADYLARAPSADIVNGISFPALSTSDVWGAFAGLTSAMLIVVAILASFSVAGVRFTLGLFIEGVDRKTYHVDLGHDVVFNAFKAGHTTSLYLTRFKELSQDKSAIVLKRRYPIGDEVVLAFGYNPDRPEQGTEIATAAYSKNAYGIYRSLRASNTRDSVVNDIIGRCHYGKTPIEKIKEEELTDYASSRVYEVAVAPAQSPLTTARNVFSELDRYYQVAIVSTFVAAVAVIVAASLNIGTGQAGDILTILFALMVGEIGVAVYQERKKGKEPLSWELSESLHRS